MADTPKPGAASTPAPGGTVPDPKTPAPGAGDSGKPAEGQTADAKAKADADAKAATDAAAAAAAAKPVPPEKYELTIPDGAEAFIDAATVTAMSARAKQRGWTNDQAQAELEELADSLAAQSTAWRSETEADPVYGGDKLADNQRVIGQLLDRYAPADDPLGAELRADLARSGYGNKRAAFAFLSKIAHAMREDRPGAPAGSGSTGGEKTLTEHLYPTTSGKA